MNRAERDRFWMQATVWMEARGEGPEGMEAVAHVILNRLRHGRYGVSLGQVVLQPWQFSCWNTDAPTRGTLALVTDDEDTWQAAGRAGDHVLAGSPDPTGGACHYYNPAIAHPVWDRARCLPRVTIGRHVFVRNVP